MLKSASIFAASVAAASTAVNVVSSATKNPYHIIMDDGAIKQRDYASDKFAPRFDGLRFIETLITAHR